MLRLKAILLSLCLFLAGPLPALAEKPAESPPPETGSGAAMTALLSFPEYFCVWTEQSRPYAYIGFALRMDGKLRYFRTLTDCGDFRGRMKAVTGEQVTLYGGDSPTAIRREDGTYYRIEETGQIRNFFRADSFRHVHQPPPRLENPHPDRVLAECRLLGDGLERDNCLWMQAGLQADASICEELSEERKSLCAIWVENIRRGKTNR